MDGISPGKFKIYSDLFYSYFFNLSTPLVIILNNFLRPIFNPTSFFTDVFHTRSVIDQFHWKSEEWEYSKLIQIYFIATFLIFLLCYSSFWTIFFVRYSILHYFFTDVFHTRSVIDQLHWKSEEWEYNVLF